MSLRPFPRAGTPPAGTSDSQGLGIALVIIGAIIIPISDGLVKLMSDRYAAVELVWLRYSLQTAALLPLMLYWYGLSAFRTRDPTSQFLRAVFITSAAVCFFTAVKTIPLADAVAVFFIQPFVVTALAPLVLGERVGVWRWSAVAAGFLGALIIIRPGLETVNTGTLFALGAGASFACFILITRRMAGNDPPMVTNFLTSLGATLLISPAVPFVWMTPAAADWPVLLWIALLGTAFSILIVLAYEYAPASVLAPFFYIELISAAVVGYLLFSDIPDAATWAGMAVIAASGLVIVWRENVRRPAGSVPIGKVD